jgi:hypothetical protein
MNSHPSVNHKLQFIEKIPKISKISKKPPWRIGKFSMFLTAVAASDAVCQSPRRHTDAGGAAGAGAGAAAYGKTWGIEVFVIS